MSAPDHHLWRICVLVVAFAFPSLCAFADEPTLEQHLTGITLKRVEYRELPLADALIAWTKAVRAQSRRKFSVRVFDRAPQDADRGLPVPGLNVPDLPPGAAADRDQPSPITLTLMDVPAIEVLKYISNLANYRLDFTDDGLTLYAGQLRRLDWVTETFPMSPLAVGRAKTAFAQGPLPRPSFSLEGALALAGIIPDSSLSFRWNSRRDAVTVEGPLDVVERIRAAFETWNTPPAKPRPLPRMTECDTKVLALYERLNGLVLRDVLIAKGKLEDALAELEELCIETSGKKDGGHGLTIRGKLPDWRPGPIHLKAEEISAWKALKTILRQGAFYSNLSVHRGRLVITGTPSQDCFLMSGSRNNSNGIPDADSEDYWIREFGVPKILFTLEPPPGGWPNSGKSAKDFLAASGVTFDQGLFTMYSPASQTLVIKERPERLLQIKKHISETLAKAGIRKPQAFVDPVITDGNQPVPDGAGSGVAR